MDKVDCSNFLNWLNLEHSGSQTTKTCRILQEAFRGVKNKSFNKHTPFHNSHSARQRIQVSDQWICLGNNCTKHFQVKHQRKVSVRYNWFSPGRVENIAAPSGGGLGEGQHWTGNDTTDANQPCNSSSWIPCWHWRAGGLLLWPQFLGHS